MFMAFEGHLALAKQAAKASWDLGGLEGGTELCLCNQFLASFTTSGRLVSTASHAAISPREVERTREGTEEHLVWEKRTRRTGLCSWSDYYVARPEQRSITESYKETVFELRPEQVLVSWLPPALMT